MNIWTIGKIVDTREIRDINCKGLQIEMHFKFIRSNRIYWTV